MSDLNNGNFYLNKIFAFLKDIEDEKSFLPDNDKDLKEKEINILSKDLFKDLYNKYPFINPFMNYYISFMNRI